MDDVQNVMNEMENLDKEEVAINEDKQALLGEFTTENCGSTVPCPNFTRDVTLCCTAVVKHFELANDGVINPNTVKLIYDPSCLHAIVEKARVSICGGNCGDICVYVVKIVGCIPFAFSATDAIKGPCNVPLTRMPRTVHLCCQGCVCVNNNICCYSDKRNAEAAREQIANVLNCTNTTNGIVIKTGTSPSAVVLACKAKDGSTCTCCPSGCEVDGCENETYVKFTATLTVPALPCPTFSA